MKNKSGRSAGESSANSTDAATSSLLPASPLTLEAVRALAESALKAQTWAEALTFIHEQVEMLNRLIQQSEAEEQAIYEWASNG